MTLPMLRRKHLRRKRKRRRKRRRQFPPVMSKMRRVFQDQLVEDIRPNSSNNQRMKTRRRGRPSWKSKRGSSRRSSRNSVNWKNRKSVCSNRKSNSSVEWKKNSSGRRRKRRRSRTGFVSAWLSNSRMRRSSWTRPCPCQTRNLHPKKNSTTMHLRTISPI